MCSLHLVGQLVRKYLLTHLSELAGLFSPPPDVWTLIAIPAL